MAGPIPYNGLMAQKKIPHLSGHGFGPRISFGSIKYVIKSPPVVDEGFFGNGSLQIIDNSFGDKMQEKNAGRARHPERRGRD